MFNFSDPESVSFCYNFPLLNVPLYSLPKENLNEDLRIIILFRFVNLVKAKTPKVTFYSDKAKCLLMENDPDPDFEACFYEGKKL